MKRLVSGVFVLAMLCGSSVASAAEATTGLAWQFDGKGDAQLLSENLGTSLDLILEQAVMDQDTAEPLSAALDWQYEYESMRSKRAKSKDVEATVDFLLATDWA